MLSNARGTAVILGTVTPATFRGPPIVCCSADYTAPFNAQAWTNLLVLAAELDAPAVHADVAHDVNEVPILAALANLQTFYSPGFPGPWLHSTGGATTTPPVCGPIFYFDGSTPNPSTDAPGTGGWLANRLALGSANFRRNQLYGYACEAVWPNVADQATYGASALDLIQRPPIHMLWINMGSASENWFTRVTAAQWRNLQPNSLTLRELLIEGYTELAVREATYRGITRHVNPGQISAGYGLFVWPWTA